jgi:SAM-dependent methyltransferase
MSASLQAKPKAPHLRLLPYKKYPQAGHTDPVRYYYWPLLGRLYRNRVRQCLAECSGGERVLEVGFGSGVTFLNLNELYDEIHGVDLDKNTEPVAEAFQRLGVPVHLRVGNVLELPYPDEYFDTVLLISILEHLQVHEQDRAFAEICRVLKPGGQVVYGVPVERRLMVWMFRLLGYDIRQHHFSTEQDVRLAAGRYLCPVRISSMRPSLTLAGAIYEVGHFIKESQSRQSSLAGGFVQ